MSELTGVLIVAVLMAAAFCPLWMVVQLIIENGSDDG